MLKTLGEAIALLCFIAIMYFVYVGFLPDA